MGRPLLIDSKADYGLRLGLFFLFFTLPLCALDFFTDLTWAIICFFRAEAQPGLVD